MININIATIDRESTLTLFYLVPVGMREVAIQHVKTLKYIAINEKAKLTTKVRGLLLQRHVNKVILGSLRSRM